MWYKCLDISYCVPQTHLLFTTFIVRQISVSLIFCNRLWLFILPCSPFYKTLPFVFGGEFRKDPAHYCLHEFLLTCSKHTDRNVVLTQLLLTCKVREMLKGAAPQVLEMHDIRRCWRASFADCTILEMHDIRRCWRASFADCTIFPLTRHGFIALSSFCLRAFSADNPYILRTSDTFVSFVLLRFLP